MTYVLLTIAYVVSVLWARVAVRKFIAPLPATMADVIVTLIPIFNVAISIIITLENSGGNFARKYFGKN